MSNMFKCSVCPNKSYASQKALNKHDQLVHNIFKETHYQCDYYNCSETFTSKRKLLKHRAGHKLKQKVKTEFDCKLCGTFYTTKSFLRKHVNDKHFDKQTIIVREPQVPTDHYECYQCGSTFSKKIDIISHVHVGTHKTGHRRIQCPVEKCDQVCTRYQALRSHLTDTHHFELKEEKYEFKNNIEFQNWKIEIERTLKANYIKNTSKKCLRNGVCRNYYDCHRSLPTRLVENRQRHSKSMGTNKINRACPSTLVVTYHSKENISAVLYPLHVGHSQDLGRLRIDETDKLKIAGKLSQGVTVDKVLHDIRENIPKGEIERIHLLEKKDINNIIRDYSIGYSTKRHKNDALSVKLWVNAMQNLEENPVLYYKEQGDESDVFEKTDFVLIIMTQFQANSLLAFGKNKICIDGTHGLNQYGFQLYTVVVVDEFGSGIPIAFCISNRSDMLLFQVFFQNIQRKVGLISTNVFMSDDYPAFYNAWAAVMGKVPKRLLCTWHINKNWVQNSNKIRNKDKRTLVLKSLKTLQKELDEVAFLKQLEIFCNQLRSDPDTVDFFQYFSRSYLNRTEIWAYCYRKYVGINTNMYLESLHKTIKHFYLQGKKCKRLDKTINALLNLVRDKMFEKLIKLEKHQSTEKIKKIRSSHNGAKNIPKEYIKNVSENQWHVPSKELDHSYIVEKVSDVCPIFCELKCENCQICIHYFKCSCPDNVINYNICKHIHACCLQTSCKISPLSSTNSSKPNYILQEDLISMPSCNNNKDFLNSTLEVILGLNTKFNISDDDKSTISKHLDKVMDIYNLYGQVDFHAKENVNVNEKIEPQRMFPTKNKKKDPDYPYPLPFESKMIKLGLSDSNTKVVNIQTGFDHNYN